MSLYQKYVSSTQGVNGRKNDAKILTLITALMTIVWLILLSMNRHGTQPYSAWVPNITIALITTTILSQGITLMYIVGRAISLRRYLSEHAHVDPYSGSTFYNMSTTPSHLVYEALEKCTRYGDPPARALTVFVLNIDQGDVEADREEVRKLYDIQRAMFRPLQKYPKVVVIGNKVLEQVSALPRDQGLSRISQYIDNPYMAL